MGLAEGFLRVDSTQSLPSIQRGVTNRSGIQTTESNSCLPGSRKGTYEFRLRTVGLASGRTWLRMIDPADARDLPYASGI